VRAKALFATSIAIGALASLPAEPRPFEDPRAPLIPALDADAATKARDSACPTAALASTGGVMPKNPRTLAVR
jgi:hypothetical protein